MVKKKKTKEIIVGYARKSKEDKNKQNVSISAQHDLCKNYADDRHCEFVFFADVNKSGDAVKQKLTGNLNIDDDTYNELMKKWQDEKREIGNNITNLSESTKDTMTRIKILADFANRVPELYLKANLDEKRMILTTITESITINAETETITVRLRPVFEHLRLAKQSFMADLERLNGTLQTRSDRAKQALQNIRPKVNQFIDYGTRKKLLNTKIEPNFDDSIEINVEGGT